MPLTDEGAIAIASALLGDGEIDLFDNDNAALGVGDDDTDFDKSQTQLQAESNDSDAVRIGMDSDYPKRDPEDDGSSNLTRYRATFGTSEGNFDWLEWGIFNSTKSGGGTMLLRVVEDLGKKTSKASWVFEVDITVNA